jgi:protein-glutamine gamma-glutamyltransferase
VVTGYQGGEVNPISNRLVVRQSDAHAWAEVWLEGRGWTRVDPTGAVAPNRIELSLGDALPAGERVPGQGCAACVGCASSARAGTR